MSEHGLRASVVIPTFNQSRLLESTLRHLAGQTVPPDDFEVIVVDGGSPDYTRATVDAVTDLPQSSPSEVPHAGGSGIPGRRRAQRRGGTGAVQPVVRAPDPVLGRTGGRVDPTDPRTVALVADLVATMRTAPGCIGLAAPQIGQGVQVFVADVTDHPKAHTGHGLLALCNPEVVSASQWRAGREGCLSVPDFTGDVKRAGRLVVRGQLPGSGEVVELAAEGFEARVLQHEIDHCLGLLFLDRVRDARGIHHRKVYL